MVEEAESITANHKLQTSNLKHETSNTVLVHCWRGGMRSAGVAFAAFDLYGFKGIRWWVDTRLPHRKWRLLSLEKEYSFRSSADLPAAVKPAKSSEALPGAGHTIIDRSPASVKGSAFGAIGETTTQTGNV